MAPEQELWAYLELDSEDITGKIGTELCRLGSKLRMTPCGVVVLSNSEALPPQVLRYGIQKIYRISCDVTDVTKVPEELASLIGYLVVKYRPKMVVFGNSPLGSEVAAILSAEQDLGLVTSVIDLESRAGVIIARKSVYNGRAHACIGWNRESTYVVTMDLNVLDIEERHPSLEPEVIFENATVSSSSIEYIGQWKAGRDTCDIREADLVVSVGNGVRGPDVMRQVEQLAELLDAVVGGSRVARYRGLVPEERQVGISGKQIAANVYLALGISGQPYHLMGIRDVKHVIAVNCDANAPIFRRCELGVVADLHEVIDCMITLLSGQPSNRTR